MMSTEERFMKNAEVMVEVIHDAVVELNNKGHQTISPTMIRLMGGALSIWDKRKFIEDFIRNSSTNNCWHKIKEKDQEYFIEHAHEIFGSWGSNNVSFFKDFFTIKNPDGSYVINEEMREDMWNLLAGMVKISINYVHENRDPEVLLLPENRIKFVYRREFLPEVNLNHHLQTWSVKLTIPKK